MSSQAVSLSSRSVVRVLVLAFAACGSGAGGSGRGGGAQEDANVDNPSGLVKPSDFDAGSAGMQRPHDAGHLADAGKGGCGDGKLQPGELCDDGNGVGGDGCSADCQHVEQDFVCPAPGVACVTTVICGDGRIAGRETCDDGNTRDGDGCSKGCTIVAGYLCAAPGRACTAAKCGDGIVAGAEGCDDGNTRDADGCSAACVTEAGSVCPEAGKPCRATVCNDGHKEGSEPCDDGNQVVGDGCTPFCEIEPDCSAGACHSRCGDGMILPTDAEECDDGNTNDHDGCSAQCKIEQGYSCTLQQDTLPETLQVPVTYRDFVALPASGTRHPDFEIFHGSSVTPGLLATTLGSDGKPVYTGLCDDAKKPYPGSDPNSGNCPYNQQMTTQANFDQWYRDVPGVNVSKVERMQLARDAASGAYKIANASFFPWDGDSRSWVGQSKESLKNGHDFGFTSEVRTYFEFTLDALHPQVLSFSGDDDVWVFINHKLAVDIGGLHSQQTRSITLDSAAAATLGLEEGKIYEAALFHAERHSSASNFNLTLDGFVRAKTHCVPKCGDGLVVGTEACDDGVNKGGYGSCTPSCERGPYCGDGVVDPSHEACDDGVNLTIYSSTGKSGCAPGCKVSAFCGDGHIDSQAGEQCDNSQNRGGYGECNSSCRLVGRCGDGIIQREAGEICDDGNLINGDGCSSSCKGEGPQ